MEMFDSILTWFLFLLGGEDFSASITEMPELVYVLVVFAFVAILATMAFVFKFILKLVDR